MDVRNTSHKGFTLLPKEENVIRTKTDQYIFFSTAKITYHYNIFTIIHDSQVSIHIKQVKSDLKFEFGGNA